MKNIKDYLHLYLGCEAYVFPDDTLSNGWLDAAVKNMPALQYKIPVTLDRVKYIIERGYKPILRPLSDMTEDEKVEYSMLRYVQRATPIHTIMVSVDSPESFRWMLSKGFDLFDLIPAGLAIDRTTLKQTV